MDVMNVVGVRSTRFTAQDGKEISGVSLYVTFEDSHVKGLACDRLFISDNKLGALVPTVGDCVTVSYNKYGKIQSLEIV